MTDLSILIPSRNEMFLAQTVENVLANIGGDTEIIAVLDGAPADPPVPVHPKVRIISLASSIGQRAATNEAARASTAKFLMKLDAHCAVDKDFDIKLMQECNYDWTVIPRMYNLHAFDWQCKKCGNRTYQGPYPVKCQKCDNTTEFERVIVWLPRWGRKTDFARFDNTLHFQYWSNYGKRPEAQGDIADMMCSVGACWFMHRDRFWELGGCDERHGSWGQFGVEWACKATLSGGRHVVNKRTWFAHMFRTQPGFGFPYPISGSAQERAREHSRWLWESGNWEKAIHPLSWLIAKFAPVPDWPTPTVESTKSKGMVYYTDNKLDEHIATKVQQTLQQRGHEIISVSLKPMNFGRNIHLNLERGYLTMFKQILAGLEASRSDIVFLTEHDVLYHPSHFDFVPPQPDIFYYNINVWKLRYEDGHSVKVNFCQQTSGLCAYRELLVEHYRKRVERVEKEGYSTSIGFEPGTHQFPRGIDEHTAESWQSVFPNIDIRHNKTLTPSRWSPDKFRNKKYAEGWTETDEEIPGWGKVKDILQSIRG